MSPLDKSSNVGGGTDERKVASEFSGGLRALASCDGWVLYWPVVNGSMGCSLKGEAPSRTLGLDLFQVSGHHALRSRGARSLNER